MRPSVRQKSENEARDQYARRYVAVLAVEALIQYRAKGATTLLVVEAEDHPLWDDVLQVDKSKKRQHRYQVKRQQTPLSKEEFAGYIKAAAEGKQEVEYHFVFPVLIGVVGVGEIRTLRTLCDRVQQVGANQDMILRTLRRSEREWVSFLAKSVGHEQTQVFDLLRRVHIDIVGFEEDLDNKAMRLLEPIFGHSAEEAWRITRTFVADKDGVVEIDPEPLWRILPPVTADQVFGSCVTEFAPGETMPFHIERASRRVKRQESYLKRIRTSDPLPSAAALLNPDSMAVPLMGRDAEKKALHQWLHEEAEIAVRAVIGEAGSGKTRLALELLLELESSSDQWECGFVSEQSLRQFLSRPENEKIVWGRPVLLVFEYAAAQVDLIRQFLKRLTVWEHVSKIRVILLERFGDAGGPWLSSLLGEGHDRDVLTPLFEPRDPLVLTRFDDIGFRRELFDSMLQVCVQHFGSAFPPLPAVGENPAFDQRLRAATLNRPLFLLMAAIEAGHSSVLEAVSLTRRDLAMRVAEHEAKRLRHFIPEDRANDRSYAEFFTHVSAAVTLVGGHCRDEVLGIVEREAEEARIGLPEGAASTVDALQTALPGDGGIAPILPDLIGEAYVLKYLAAGSPNERSTMAVLRLCNSYGLPVVHYVVRVIQDFPREREAAALEWLDRVVEVADTVRHPGLLFVLDAVMPRETVVLRRKAVQILERMLTKLQDTDESTGKVRWMAHVHHTLAGRLIDLKQFDESLTHADRAIHLLGELEQKWPGQLTLELALTHSNRSDCLCNLGKLEEAILNAEDVDRLLSQLPESDEIVHAYCLGSISRTFRHNGELDLALTYSNRSVGIRERILLKNPGALPLLAASLHNQSALLMEMSRVEDALKNAERSLELRQSLAEEHPDSYLPHLANAHYNLAQILRKLDRLDAIEHARSALAIRKELIEHDSAVFWEELVQSFDLLARLCFTHGDADALLECVQARAEYGSRPPDQTQERRAEYADFLSQCSLWLLTRERFEETFQYANEAAMIYKRLRESGVEVSSENVAYCLHSSSLALHAMGRAQEALVSLVDEFSVVAPLVAADVDLGPIPTPSAGIVSECLRALPDPESGLVHAKQILAYADELLNALNDDESAIFIDGIQSILSWLRQQGQWELVNETHEQLARTLEVLTDSNPKNFAVLLARAVYARSEHLRPFGRDLEVREQARRVLPALRELVNDEPHIDQLQVAEHFAELASVLGNSDEAFSAAEEAMRIVDEFPQQDDVECRRARAAVLSFLALLKSYRGEYREASEGTQEALDLYDALETHAPSEEKLARLSHNLGTFLMQDQRVEEGIRRMHEALAIHEKLTEENPMENYYSLGISFDGLAQGYAHIGNDDEALHFARESVRVHQALKNAYPDGVFDIHLANALAVTAQLTIGATFNEEDVESRIKVAAEALDEAIPILADHAKANPSEFLPRVAGLMRLRGV